MAPAMRIRYGRVNGRTRRSAGKSRDGAGASEGRESRGGFIRRFYPKFPSMTLSRVRDRGPAPCRDDVIGGVGASGSPGVDEPCVQAGLPF
jgi:hypothetical protein